MADGLITGPWAGNARGERSVPTGYLQAPPRLSLMSESAGKHVEVPMSARDLEEFETRELCARVHEEVFRRSVLEDEPGEPVDPESGEPVPNYVADPVALFGRFDDWGYRVFVRGGESQADGMKGVTVVAVHASRETVTRRAESRGRAYCEAALEIARSEPDS